jgi:tetratricopeptide (TPR) repeat protein
VFQLLDLGRETGVLTVTSQVRQNAGTVYFEQGAVVHAAIGTNPHLFGTVLLRAGRRSETDLARARQAQQRGDDRRLGEILVSMGVLGRDELEHFVRRQIVEVVFEIMSWREGHFHFADGPFDASAVEAPVRLPAGSLLLEAARRIDEWERIRARIPHLRLVPILTAPEPANRTPLELLPEEWEILAVADGARSLEGISAELGRSAFEVARAVLGLQSAGVLDLKDRHPSVAAARPTADGEALEHLVARADTALGDGDEDAVARVMATLRSRFPDEPIVAILQGRIAAQGADLAGAEQAFRQALRVDPLMAPAHLHLGDVLARQGRFKEATEWWERWLTVAAHSEAEAADVVRVREAVRAARALESYLVSDRHNG